MKSLKFLPFLTVLLLASCKSDPEVTTAEANSIREDIVITHEQFEHNEMELGELTEKNFPEIIRANGQVDVPPENFAKVSVFEGGYVKRIPLLEGSNVKQGQLILSLENPRYIELQQEYLELAGQLTYLKSEFDRQQIMLDEKITSKKNFLKTESDYKTGMARYNGLRKKLQMLNIDPQKVEAGNVTSEINIYAPISGNVDQINVSKGMFVEPTHSVLEIVNTNHLHLELQVFEKDVMKLRKGQKISFSLPQEPSISYDAEISLVGKTIDENRMATVHAHFSDSLKNRFAVGMFIEAQINTHNHLQTALPEDAIIEVDNAHYVLVLKNRNGTDYVFTRREVNPLTTYKEFTAVENSDIFKGKQVLTKGAFNLIGN